MVTAAPAIRSRARQSVLIAIGVPWLYPRRRKEIIVEAAMRGLLRPETATRLLRECGLVHA